MKRFKLYIGIAITAVMLTVSCRKEEIIERNYPKGELSFNPTLGSAETATRAGESDNSVLKKAADADGFKPTHIVIETYTGTPGTLTRYFSDKLGYYESRTSWDLTSGTVRFLPSSGMNLYGYFATDFAESADLTNVIYSHPTAPESHPKLTFTVTNDDALHQVDLIAAKVEGITKPEILIPFRHILSQINFGVKGIDHHQIMVKNIRLNGVSGQGIFDYNTWQWTPNNTITHNYPYYFPDRNTTIGGLGDNYQTRGSADDSNNTYIFGDGGKFGPGSDNTFLYAQINPTVANYAIKAHTNGVLHNSFMLIPQEITKNKSATVTFDYEIRLDDETGTSRVVKGGSSSVRLDTYYDWKPNYRYVYVFQFDDPTITFNVLVEPWEYYNGTDGVVGSEELDGNNIYKLFVHKKQAGESSVVPLSKLSANMEYDWSLNSLQNSFKAAGQSFSLTFGNALNYNGKTITIKPPFGFSVTPSVLSASSGSSTVVFTPLRDYYTTASEVNAALGNGGGNFEFSVPQAIKPTDITFTGSATAESSLKLHYLNPYTEPLPNRWTLADAQTAVCFPNDYALTSSAPYTYTLYTVQGMKAVFDWMNNGGTPPGGSGTPTDAQRMQTNITLALLSNYNLAEVYKKEINDITNPPFVPIGTDTNPYRGTFNGNRATISNLYIESTGAARGYHGFFGYNLGTIKFVTLANVSIISGDWNVGGIAAKNVGNITGCSVSGSIRGGSVGGIVGENNGFVYSCASNATVTNAGSGYTGGIAGVTWTTVQGCYSTGSGVNIVGNNAVVSGCFYVGAADVGTVTGATRVPSVAALNGRIHRLNAAGGTLWTGAHYVSGSMNTTPPTISIGDPTPAGGGLLHGTFIQNSFALGWDDARWEYEMALIASLGMEYLVIDQVMEFSDYGGTNQYLSWYPAYQSILVNDNLSINWGTALERCMAACRKHGIKLYIGTFFDKRYWDEGAAVNGSSTEWLNCIATANNVMDDLVRLYFNGASSTKADYSELLAGWYFPYEVDDLSFQTALSQSTLKTGITLAMNHRTTSAKDKPYLFSPFMNGSGLQAIGGTMTSMDYAALWSDIMANCGFKTGDILSPQDCIGTGKLTLTDLSDWMPKLNAAATNQGVAFWINIETFGPGGNVSYLTTQQIPASKMQSPAKLISFSYPIYYSPQSWAKQGDHAIYKIYYDKQ